MGRLVGRRFDGENFEEQAEDIGNAEGLLQMARGAGSDGRFRGFEEFTGHIDDGGFAITSGGEKALGGGPAVHIGAILRKIQVTEQNVRRAAGEASESLFQGGGAIDVQAARGEAFGKKAAEAFFVVEDEDGAALEEIESGRRGRRGSRGGNGGKRGLIVKSEREIDGERGTAGRKGFGFDGAAVLANDGEADAEAEAGAAAGALGGVKGIEETRDGFGANADAVVLKGDGDARAKTSEADLNAAGFADFADGLLGIGDEIEKDLDELVGIANDAGEIGLRTEIDFDAVAAEGVFVKLERALDDAIEIDGFFLGRGRAGEFEKILNDASGAAGLAMGEFELALGGLRVALAFAQ